MHIEGDCNGKERMSTRPVAPMDPMDLHVSTGR